MAIAALAMAVAACGGGGSEQERTAAPPATGFQGPLVARAASLPEDDRQAHGTGAAVLTANCVACHSVEMIDYQPPLTRAQWQATVEKMRKVYHAPVAEADVPALVAALVQRQRHGADTQ